MSAPTPQQVAGWLQNIRGFDDVVTGQGSHVEVDLYTRLHDNGPSRWSVHCNRLAQVVQKVGSKGATVEALSGQSIAERADGEEFWVDVLLIRWAPAADGGRS